MDSADINLSQTKQLELLSIPKSSFHYHPVPMSSERLKLMMEIEQLYSKRPVYGSRRLYFLLTEQGEVVSRRVVCSIMKDLGIEGITPKKQHSYRNKLKEQNVYPYKLSGLKITAKDQVWSTDITYIRVENGFMYLSAVIDWYTRHVIAWKISNSLDATTSVEVLQEALTKGKPQIFNSDQGVQYTSDEFLNVLISNKIEISMDGIGRALDNIYIERFWRTIKYEDIYIQRYETVPELMAGVARYIEFYNEERPHMRLNGARPGIAYRNNVTNLPVIEIKSRGEKKKQALKKIVLSGS